MKENHETVEMTRTLPVLKTQASIEGTLRAPEEMPDMADILWVEGRADVDHAETLENGVMIEGDAEFTVIYNDRTNEPYSFTMVTRFKHSVEAPDVQPGMEAEAEGSIIGLDFTMKNAREAETTTLLELRTHVEDPVRETILTSASGDALEVQRRRIRIPGRCCRASAAHIARDDAILPQGDPPARRVLACTGMARVLSSVFEDGKLAVRGTVRQHIVYATAERTRPIMELVHDIPFEHLLDMGECRACEHKTARARVRESECRIEDEGRALRIEATVIIDGRCCSTIEMEAVTDAYSTHRRIALDNTQIRWQRPAGEEQGKLSLRETIQRPESLPPQGDILLVRARPVVTGEMAGEGSVQVEGVVQCQVIYATPEGKAAAYPAQIPFVMKMACENAEEGMSVLAEVSPEHAGPGPNGEVRLELAGRAQVLADEKASYARAISEEEDKEASSGLWVHFAGGDDTAWALAKEYGVTLKALEEANPGMTRDRLEAGQKILIFKPCEPC